MEPLAERMRPKKIEDLVGQEHLLGPGATLRTMIDSGRLLSTIFWGPPGIGKTSLAMLLALENKRPFYTLSAISAGVKDVRDVIEKAKNQSFFDAHSPVLFIDEIHRFSKSQQHALLQAVEKGIITLIGATTENPSFEVISALLSRCQVLVLEPLGKTELEGLIHKAIKDDSMLRKLNIELESTKAILRYSGGDARKLFNALEIVCNTDQDPIVISDKSTTKLLQNNLGIYDKGGEMHYDVISAYIKSIRGSDPNAGVYWLARMIEGGEDIAFISRRLVILASEDIGLANPNALLIANACFEAVRKIGLPEARIILSQATIYLACSPKSNSAYLAIKEAQSTVKKQTNLAVPLHLRNAPTKLMKELGYGDGYKYSHDFEQKFTDQQYLPEDLDGTAFYNPDSSFEERFTSFLKARWGKKYGY